MGLCAEQTILALWVNEELSWKKGRNFSKDKLKENSCSQGKINIRSINYFWKIIWKIISEKLIQEKGTSICIRKKPIFSHMYVCIRTTYIFSRCKKEAPLLSLGFLCYYILPNSSLYIMWIKICLFLFCETSQTSVFP